MRKSVVLFVACAPLFLFGCGPMAVATGAVVGVNAAQEGGLSAAVSDAGIQIAINDLWFKYDVETFGKLDLTVNQGRVLITGVVQDPDKRVEAVRLAWQPKGVKQVINEIRIAESSGILGYSQDVLISARLRAKITLDSEVQSLNYTIDTVQGTVYLMGAAQNQAEIDRVTELASRISGVKQVVSYVKIIGEKVDPVEVQ